MPNNYTLSGVIAGDSVALNDPVAGTYATASPGAGIPVTVSGLALSGASAGNYRLLSETVTGNIGEILPLPTADLITQRSSLITQPTTLAKFDSASVYLPFGGNVACIPSTGSQKASNLPLLSGFGVSDRTVDGAVLLDQPYAAAEMQDGVLMPVTLSPCEALTSFRQTLFLWC